MGVGQFDVAAASLSISRPPKWRPKAASKSIRPTAKQGQGSLLTTFIINNILAKCCNSFYFYNILASRKSDIFSIFVFNNIAKLGWIF